MFCSQFFIKVVRTLNRKNVSLVSYRSWFYSDNNVLTTFVHKSLSCKLRLKPIDYSFLVRQMQKIDIKGTMKKLLMRTEAFVIS